MNEPPTSKGQPDEPAPLIESETIDESPSQQSKTRELNTPSDPAFSLDPVAAKLVDPMRTTDFRFDDSGDVVAARLEASDSPATTPTQEITGKKKPAVEPLPKTVAGYEILGLLGRGGMGVVYKARQPGLKRLVALKMILGGVHAGEGELARFRSEAEAVAQLQHPNIVQIYEVGEDGGQPFFSLEYIEGESLAKMANATPLPPRQAAELLLQLAHGIEYAHQKGIIHRDLKPANVLMSADGLAKITDFGLAKRVEDESGQTRSGTVLGTPSYMPPEQAEGRLHEMGARSDVYSLGAVLYDLLTGRPPFRGTTVLDTLRMVQSQEPVAPAEFQPSIPRDLQTICLKCLQKDPARRYASAADLAEDLRRFLCGEPILARPAGAAERFWRWCRRNPRIASLSAALVLLLMTWAATSSYLYSIATRNEIKAQNNEQQAIQEKARADARADEANRNAETARTRQQSAFMSMVALGEELQKRLRSRRLSEQLGPQVQQMRQQLMDVLRHKMLELAGDSENKGIRSFGSVALHQQLGDLLLRMGLGKEAEREYQEGSRRIEKEVQEQPNSDRARANLGIMMMRLGDISLEVKGNAKEARDYYQKGWDSQNEVILHPHDANYPYQQKAIVLSHHGVRLGRANLAMGHPREAVKHLEDALKLRQEWSKAVSGSAESRSYLVEVNMWLGAAAWRRDDAKAFDRYFHEALERAEQLAKESPNDYSFKSDLAEVYAAQADGLARLGRHEEAGKSQQRSWENLSAVMSHDPDDPAPLPLLAILYERLGADAQRRGKPEEARKHYQEALTIRHEFVQLGPENRMAQVAYLLALARCGQYAKAARSADALRPQAALCAELLLQLARCYAVCAAAQPKEDCLAKAMKALQALAALDYHDAMLLRTDPDLAALRNEAAFRALLDSLQRRP